MEIFGGGCSFVQSHTCVHMQLHMLLKLTTIVKFQIKFYKELGRYLNSEMHALREKKLTRCFCNHGVTLNKSLPAPHLGRQYNRWLPVSEQAC